MAKLTGKKETGKKEKNGMERKRMEWKGTGFPDFNSMNNSHVFIHKDRGLVGSALDHR